MQLEYCRRTAENPHPGCTDLKARKRHKLRQQSTLFSDSTTGCILKPKAEILINGIFLAAEE